MSLPQGFCYLDEAVPGIRVRAAYYYDDNFTGARVDGYNRDTAIGTVELAAALRIALKAAQAHGYGLLIWDAYRPQRAVACFERWAAAPEDNRTRAAHYPRVDKRDMFALGYIASRSGHSRGSTVDLTFTDSAGAPVDMGTIFDYMDDDAHHDVDTLPAEVQQRRNLLRQIMIESGFKPYQAEWWHYTLADEPYEDTYFDFQIE